MTRWRHTSISSKPATTSVSSRHSSKVSLSNCARSSILRRVAQNGSQTSSALCTSHVSNWLLLLAFEVCKGSEFRTGRSLVCQVPSRTTRYSCSHATVTTRLTFTGSLTLATRWLVHHAFSFSWSLEKSGLALPPLRSLCRSVAVRMSFKFQREVHGLLRAGLDPFFNFVSCGFEHR